MWKYCEYLLAYLLIIVSFDDVTLDVIVLFIFGLTLARDTVRSLQRNNVAFIEPDVWPPNSPDLNPVDYTVWGELQQLVTNIEASRLSPN